MPTRQLCFGVDRLIEAPDPDLRRRRIALLTNDAATTAALPHPVTPSRVAVLTAGYNVVSLLSPEHGLAAAAADGATVTDSTDPLTGLKVRSLYGDAFRPTTEMLADVDAVVVDLADIGARFYTYIWTTSHVLEACAEAGKPVWVLDRPNPLGGDLAAAEGPTLDASVVPTLVGRWPVPVRHSLTLGELARLWNDEQWIGADLHVVPMTGWDRRHRWPSLGLPFVPTSPAMPSYETALLYPGTCLIEGLEASEGRGTATPFRVTGAPWMDGNALADAFNAAGLSGVVARPISFTPTASEHAGQACNGVMLHVVDEDTFRPVATGLRLVSLMFELHPDACHWRGYPTAADRAGAGHFDVLVGRADVRPVVEAAPTDIACRIAEWTDPGDWAERVAAHLLY